MKPIIVVGAGLSGLIAAEALSANGFDYEIFETKKEIEFNPTENAYYLHSDNIQKILPISLKKVKVYKYFYDWTDGRYINKITPKILFDYTQRDHGLMTDSSIEECGKELFGYIPQFTDGIHKILYNRHRHKINFDYTFDPFVNIDQVKINTSSLSFNLKFEISDVHRYTLENMNLNNIIIIHSNCIFKRAILKNNTIYIEELESDALADLVINRITGCNIQSINIEKTRKIFQVKKFKPINEVERKNILFNLTKNYNIYSLGRYATQSYKRIDHVVEDALDIVKMIRFSQQGRW